MLAAVFKGNGVLSVEEVPVPVIENPTDVLIKVRAASICGSDLHCLNVPPAQYAKPGTIMGHEFYGEVAEIGSGVTQFQVGDYVVVDNILKCHNCEDCKTGHDNLCLDAKVFGQTLNGGFAQYSLIPEAQLYHMPKEVPSYCAAQTEPLSCVMNGMSKLSATPDKKVLVYGAGPIGLTYIRVLKLHGIKHLAVAEMSPFRRAYAEKCGAEFTVDTSKENLKDVLQREWGSGCDIAIDAVGVGPIFGEAVELLNGGGTLLIVGQNANALSEVKPATIVRNELTVKGMYCAHFTFPTAIKLLQNEDLGLEKFLTNKVELKDILTGIEALRKQEACRVVVYPNGIC
ncbi:MAG: alcohol dehydrogenase catalytic domain-containing protein [Eubacterium sp.]|nr:alcohol dehydrogenase catalytic domain-containing protein [Eubacterium sp.]